MNIVIPTVFAVKKSEFLTKLEKLLPIAKEIQIDIMDGKFVQSKSISVEAVPDMKKYPNRFEAHLMVSNPRDYIKTLSNKKFKKIIFHYESLFDTNKIMEIIKEIKRSVMKSFIAINPETSVSQILPFIRKVDGVLLMGVYPGKEKQKFIDLVYSKVETLHDFNKDIIIQIDGGVNESVARKLSSLGASIINSGSFISESKNPEEALKRLEEAFNE